jgi:predicted DNA-binding protein
VADTEKVEQMPFRAPAELMQLLRECAARYGRTAAEELRIAVELHVTTSAIHELARPGVREKLGEEAAAVETQMREHLRALAERAYRPPLKGLLESLLWVGEQVRR